MCAEVIKSLQACVFFERGHLIMENPVVCAIGRQFELKLTFYDWLEDKEVIDFDLNVTF